MFKKNCFKTSSHLYSQYTFHHHHLFILNGQVFLNYCRLIGGLLQQVVVSSTQPMSALKHLQTRKLCYRKDDCTLHMGALKIFGTP